MSTTRHDRRRLWAPYGKTWHCAKGLGNARGDRGFITVVAHCGVEFDMPVPSGSCLGDAVHPKPRRDLCPACEAKRGAQP